jgi:hypothetical protein
MLGLILLIVLILLVVGAVPSWPYSRSWGYGPSGILGVLLIVLIVLMLFSVIPAPWAPPSHTVIVR